MKKHLLFVLLFISISNIVNAQCDNTRYLDKVFTEVKKTDNVFFARKLTSTYEWINLVYDVYEPEGDTARNRPLVFMMHGGAYLKLVDEESPEIVELAKDLALRGYVVISMNYRQESNFLNLLSEEYMVKALVRSLIDVRDASCQIVELTDNENNPYGIDLNNVIALGSSAGAVSFLHGLFLQDTSKMLPNHLRWAKEIAGDSIQDMLDNPVCGAKVIGLVSMSGAILDLSYIDRQDIALFNIHGTRDNIVPYGYGRPFGYAGLPFLYGGSKIHEYALSHGIRSQFDSWEGGNHVPIFDYHSMFGFLGECVRDIPHCCLLNDPTTCPITEAIFVDSILDTTKIHISKFCYDLVCNSSSVGINEYHLGEVRIYPNPSTGSFYLETPTDFFNKKVNIEVYNTIGENVFERQYVATAKTLLELNNNLPQGNYWLILTDKETGKYFTGKIMLVK